MSVNNSRLKHDDEKDAPESHQSDSVDDDDEMTDKKVHSSVAALWHLTSCQMSIAIQATIRAISVSVTVKLSICLNF